MKLFLTLTTALFITTIYFDNSSSTELKISSVQDVNTDRIPASARAPQQLPSCTYSPNDIKPITAYGSDIHKARSAASKVCFERRIDLFEKTKNAFPTTAQGQRIIDSCVNIDCQ